MRRRTKRKLKKGARKHGLFLGALAALLVVVILAWALAPRTEGNGGRWHIWQVRPAEER
jgi:hypothetical protein